CWTESWMVLGVGNFRTRPIRKKGGSRRYGIAGPRKSVTVGYRYYFGIHMGLNLGECDEIIEIKVADRTAWSGSATTNTSIWIDEPELFGGDESEGGIVGTLDVMMGGPDQPVIRGSRQCSADSCRPS